MCRQGDGMRLRHSPSCRACSRGRASSARGGQGARDAGAEKIFRDVIRRYSETLPADNVNLGIAHVKLGRTLLRQNRYADAESETRAGYEILIKQSSPSTSFTRAARKDLAAEYDALNQPQQAARFRAELAAVAANSSNTAR